MYTDTLSQPHNHHFEQDQRTRFRNLGPCHTSTDPSHDPLSQVLRDRGHVPPGLDVDGAGPRLGPRGLRRHDRGDEDRSREPVLLPPPRHVRPRLQIRNVGHLG